MTSAQTSDDVGSTIEPTSSLPSKIISVWIDRFCVRYDWWRRLQPTLSVSPVWVMIYVICIITYTYIINIYAAYAVPLLRAGLIFSNLMYKNVLMPICHPTQLEILLLRKMWRSPNISHWNGSVVILTKLSSLDAPIVDIRTTSSWITEAHFINTTTFMFQRWSYVPSPYITQPRPNSSPRVPRKCVSELGQTWFR